MISIPKYLTIGIVGYNVRVGRGVSRFQERINMIVRDLSHLNVDLIIFPEYLGFDMVPISGLRNLIEDAASYYDNYIDIFRNASTKYNVYVLAGTTSEPIGKHYYNTAHIFTPTGEILKYRKIFLHRIDKDLGFREGREILLTRIKDVPIGVEICYDLGFSELTKIYALNGALGILSPAMAPGYGAYMWLRYCAHARAIEIQGFVALSTGTLKIPKVNISFYSKPSLLITTDYKEDGVLSEGKTIITASIDISKLQLIREKTMAPIIRDTKIDVINKLLDSARNMNE